MKLYPRSTGKKEGATFNEELCGRAVCHQSAQVAVQARLVQGSIGAVLYRSPDEERSTRAHYAAYNR